MDLRQAKLILDKINRLYESMQLDERNIDVFEQDLMLSYVKQLYDSFSDEEVAAPPKIKRTVTRRARPVIKEKPAVEPIEVVPEPVQVAKPTPPAPPTPPPAPPVQEAPKVYTPPQPITPPPPVKPKANPEHEVLFEQPKAKELSEKLSAQPISDLNKAMGINEKILTVNELFNKDNGAYSSTISKLNSLSSFEEAKEVLSEAAEKYGWTDRDKKKKAQIFIKLVRRRYS